MSGWQTVYLDTGTEANARALAVQLGSDLEPGSYSAGDENYCFLAYTPLVSHDDATWSYAVLSRWARESNLESGYSSKPTCFPLGPTATDDVDQ